MPGAHDGFEQLMELPLLMTPELASGKTFIVTGGNGGLGYEAIQHLVKMGAATVIMAVRTVSKGEEAKQEIEEATGVKDVIQVWQLDKTSYESVKAFAAKVLSELDHVDSLIDNAGVAASTPVKSEGHNENMTVNAYSSLLLATLLMPSMSAYASKSATTPHITIVSSGAAFFAQESWDKVKDLDDVLASIDDEAILPPMVV
ncbi:short chain dehydrogenase domain-containing protein [Sarocladium implicatum]|nr:short chain dehydrogenase domain-containing protein [Sarocladium implicatum]